jgi:hypothetical protein
MSGKKDGTVTEDQMLLAFNKIRLQNVDLAEARDFYQTVRSRAKGATDDVEIDDLIDFMNGQI